MKVKKSDKSSSKENENIFSVEKILDKKIKKGKTFYFIKWFNYSDNHSSWEPEKNVQLYPGLIEEYEEEMRENETKGREQTPKRVIGLIHDPENEFKFFMELESGKMETMPRWVAYQSCPQLVIEYYRSVFEWKNNGDEGSDKSNRSDASSSSASESSV